MCRLLTLLEAPIKTKSLDFLKLTLFLYFTKQQLLKEDGFVSGEELNIRLRHTTESPIRHNKVVLTFQLTSRLL